MYFNQSITCMLTSHSQLFTYNFVLRADIWNCDSADNLRFPRHELVRYLPCTTLPKWTRNPNFDRVEGK